MIFNRSYKLTSSKTPKILQQLLIGKHLKVHKFDFEVFSIDNVIKIIPHAEEENGITTLPITRVKLSEKNSKTIVSIESHPRTIDIGGPYILLLLCLGIFFAGFFLGIYGGPEFESSCKIMMALPVLIVFIFWIRMEFGYFDYVRKIKNWVKTQI